jgi:hypothetical protein
MDTARKLLRLFESAREYATLAALLGQDKRPISKKLAIFGQVTMVIYWAIENLYVLAKLNILPLNKDLLLKLVVWVASILYLSTIASQALNLYEIHHGLIKTRAATDLEEMTKGQQLFELRERQHEAKLIIFKETLDSIGLLPLLGVCEATPFINLLSSAGSLIHGAMSLYMKFK